MTARLLPVGLLTCFAVVVHAQDRPAPPKATPEQLKATADTHEFFRRVTRRLADADLADVKTLADWQRLRPQYRNQLLEMLGLSPLPARTDLKPAVTGTVEGDGFVVEKLHFQSRPGLYVTANFYRPKTVPKPLPTILYLCGHGNNRSADNKQSFGSKTSYQHHAAWFAREGYCCLILDTLQLGEIEGLHHGTYREGMWWWAACGYTPAGVEAWNGIRALDYLETRPEVDMKRVGVTGRSGGGAYTWWVAALDDRPACFVPVAGITDLQDHVVGNCVEGHCDCMYMVNTYGWDFATVAALAAPRPLLFSNTDKDPIFPLAGVVRTHAKLKRIYDLHKAGDKLGLLVTEGPHKDTQELQVPAFRWFDRWLKGKDVPVTRVADKVFEPKQLTVYATPPTDQKNTTIHDTFTKVAELPPVPKSKAEWEAMREKLMTELREKCFRNWPADGAPLDVSVTTKVVNGLRIDAVEFTTEENIRLTAHVVRGQVIDAPKELSLNPIDTAEWGRTVAWNVPAYGPPPPGAPVVLPTAEARKARADLLTDQSLALVLLTPRGEGPNRWDPDPKKDAHIRRRFVLLGRTVEDAQVWDTRRALQAVRTLDALKKAKVTVSGVGKMAGIALYAALFEPAVEDISLHAMPAGETNGPVFLNVARVLTSQQAVALAFPRPVAMFDVRAHDWKWTKAVAGLYAPAKPLSLVPKPKEK